MRQRWELGRCGSALVLGKEEHGSLSSKLFCGIQKMESFFFFKCVYVHVCAGACTCALRGQEKALDCLELVQAVVNHSVWVVTTKPESL